MFRSVGKSLFAGDRDSFYIKNYLNKWVYSKMFATNNDVKQLNPQ